MNFVKSCSPLLKEYELRADPIIIRVNKFDEDSAEEFAVSMSRRRARDKASFPSLLTRTVGRSTHSCR